MGAHIFEAESRPGLGVSKIVSISIWNLGWIALGTAWLGPLPAWAMTSFAAHMTLHMAVVAIAAPFIAIGMSGQRYDPARCWPTVFSPIAASVGELVVVWAWHSPRLHHWARFEMLGFVCEQAMFLAVGLWVWLSAFGGAYPRSVERSGAGVIGLLLTSMHMTLLGALLALSPRVLFLHHPNLRGINPLFDQNLGGAIMLVIGGAAFMAGGLWLMRDLMLMRSTQYPRVSESMLQNKPLHQGKSQT